ncbi:MAG: ABC transporter permease [Cellulomonadaceae bacterium]
MTDPQSASAPAAQPPGAGEVPPVVDPGTPPAQDRPRSVLRQITEASATVVFLSIITALVLAAVLVAAANEEVQRTATYVFARPTDFFSAVWDSVWGAYSSLFRGAVFDPQAETLVRKVRPITVTLTQSVPLILAGLGLGIGFRAGLFNIGAQGQVVLGAIASAYIGFAFHLPVGLHLLVAVLGGLMAGGLWAGIAGYIKAQFGGNEVIVTIMLNSIAVFLMSYLLSTTAFKRPGSNNPISPIIDSTAAFPLLLGSSFPLNGAWLLAIAAAFATWWLMERSTWGFRFRAVGANPDASRVAGINVRMAYLWVMLIAGALAGLGGASQVLVPGGVLQDGVAGSIGFDAITVALLGRSKPLGTVLAATLFGALRAGSPLMQTVSNTPIDIVLVVQALIVLLIAAPPLVRTIFRLPTPGVAPRKVKEVAA